MTSYDPLSSCPQRRSPLIRNIKDEKEKNRLNLTVAFDSPSRTRRRAPIEVVPSNGRKIYTKSFTSTQDLPSKIPRQCQPHNLQSLQRRVPAPFPLLLSLPLLFRDATGSRSVRQSRPRFRPTRLTFRGLKVGEMGEVVGRGVGGSRDDFFEMTEEFVRVGGGDEDFGI